MTFKTYQYRIKDSSCCDELRKLSKSVNFVWNFCRDTHDHAVKWNLPLPTKWDMNKLVSGVTKELGLHANTVQAVSEQYVTKRIQFKRAKLRKRFGRSTGWIPFKAEIKVVGDTVIYYGHTFRMWKSRELPGKPVCGSFSQDARGRWYINLVVEVDETPSTGTGEIGIDMGLKVFAVVSDGTEFDQTRWYKEKERKLARYQRQRKTKQTRNLHAKVRNCRKDFMNKLTTKLVKENQLIVVGDVSCSKLAKSGMGKSVNDRGWGLFRRLLKEKSVARKTMYLEVSEYLSTQTCSSCGSLGGPKGLEGLGVREWTCCHCGSTHHRDVNAARNILRMGHHTLSGCS